MRALALAVALSSLAAVSACGGDDGASPAVATSSAAAPDTASEAPGAASSAAPTAASGPSAGAGGAGTQLTATVGTEAEPDAYVITLADAAGQPVTTLPAGDYQIAVNDLSEIHNFHLKGDGVDETTTVPEVTETTFDVTLEAGTYTFICDPHPRMVGKVSVT